MREVRMKGQCCTHQWSGAQWWEKWWCYYTCGRGGEGKVVEVEDNINSCFKINEKIIEKN